MQPQRLRGTLMACAILSTMLVASGTVVAPGGCDRDPPVRVEGPPVPHAPSPPVAVEVPPFVTCKLKELQPPPPDPGEAPVDYAHRVVYHVCTNIYNTPPDVEVSEHCGPMEQEYGLP